MNILLMEGFDRYAAFANDTGGWWSGSLPAGRLGGTCYQIYRSSSVGNLIEVYSPTFTPISEGCFGLGTKISGTNPGNTTRYCLREGGSTYHFYFRVVNGYLTLYSGTGTVLATGTTLIAYGQWFHLGCKFKIADSGGEVVAYLNGIQELSYTGDTRNGGTGLVDRFALTTAGTSTGLDGAYIQMDDVYVTDTFDFLGDLVVETLNPVGNGASSDWVGSDGNSVDNWALVDDVSATDYVGTQTVGAKDLYALTDGSSSLGEVIAVQSASTGFKATSGGVAAGALALTHRSEGGTELDTAALMTAAAQTASAVWVQSPVLNLDPNGDPWTLARLNALQAGPKLIA